MIDENNVIPAEFVHEYSTVGYEDERWAETGYDGYFISDYGRIYSAKSEKFLKPKKMDRHGHVGAALVLPDGSRKYVYAHRLVAEAFIEENGKPNVLHFDDDPTHNYYENLRWGDQKDNHEDSVFNGGYKPFTDEAREKSYVMSRMPVLATNIKTGESIRFVSQNEAGRQLGIPQANIVKVLRGERHTAGGYIFKEAAR